MKPSVALRGMIFDGQAESRHAIEVLMQHSGYTVVATADPPRDLVDATRTGRPDVIVLELAIAGARGLRIVADLLAAAPGTRVILVSGFEDLREPALRAGAHDLVGGDDLRELQRSLQGLHGRTGMATGGLDVPDL